MHIWPVPEVMSHNGRLFVASSLIVVLGFLRGGEFLYSKRSKRGVLCGKDVTITKSGPLHSVVVSVAQPKARWWLKSTDVHCFSPGRNARRLDPVFWLSAYRNLSLVRLSNSRPAFALDDNSILSRDWMVRQTSILCNQAGIRLLDSDGKVVNVKASSWRAGGVESAKSAGLSGEVIMTMGRWSSMAWTSYAFSSAASLQKAVAAMWKAASKARLRFQVGAFNTAQMSK